jgi:hypothetical protein
MNKISPSLRSIFEEFQKIPKGILIDRPDELIATDFAISDSARDILFETKARIFFTRRSLKHVAEKTDGKRLLTIIPLILRDYDTVHFSARKNRFLFSRWILADTNIKPHIVTIEVVNPEKAIIVTTFVAKEKYLKNFEILWRTAYPPSAYPL